jgi:UDP-N-acetylglucosamine pyrophosphorylase
LWCAYPFDIQIIFCFFKWQITIHFCSIFVLNTCELQSLAYSRFFFYFGIQIIYIHFWYTCPIHLFLVTWSSLFNQNFITSSFNSFQLSKEIPFFSQKRFHNKGLLFWDLNYSPISKSISVLSKYQGNASMSLSNIGIWLAIDRRCTYFDR